MTLSTSLNKFFSKGCLTHCSRKKMSSKTHVKTKENEQYAHCWPFIHSFCCSKCCNTSTSSQDQKYLQKIGFGFKGLTLPGDSKSIKPFKTFCNNEHHKEIDRIFFLKILETSFLQAKVHTRSSCIRMLLMF